jgi:cation transport regulator
MPYPTSDDLPPSVRAHLPVHAQEIFREAFNHSYGRYGGDEERAFRIAWAAVKKHYQKAGDDWIPKAGW